jgi:hypothetical protein
MTLLFSVAIDSRFHVRPYDPGLSITAPRLPGDYVSREYAAPGVFP